MGFAMVLETMRALPAMSDSRAFAKDRDEDGVLVLTLDVPGEKVNTLGRAWLEEFEWC